MISDRAKALLSEGAFENGEQTAIFLDEEGESVVFRLFRANDHAGDPQQRAIRWLGKAKALCQSARGEIRTGVIPSKDEEAVMAIVSGWEIEAREWIPVKSADSSRLSATPAAR